MRKPRYITYYGYFGRTSNVKTAPIALSSDTIGRMLGSMATAPDKGGAK